MRIVIVVGSIICIRGGLEDCERGTKDAATPAKTHRRSLYSSRLYSILRYIVS